MSDELKVSERDAVLRERKAFARGAYLFNVSSSMRCAEDRAAKEYPLPKIERPRVVQEHGTGFKMRYVNGDFEHHVDDGKGWRRSFGSNSCAVTAERVKLWADLLERPTELVEAQ